MLNADRPGRSDAIRRRLAAERLEEAVDDAQQRSSGFVRSIAWPEVLLWAFAIFLLTSPFTFWAMNTDPVADMYRDASSLRTVESSQWRLYAMRAAVVVLAMILSVTALRRLPAMMARLWPVAPFMLWAMLSILWSDAPTTSLNSVVAMLMLILASAFICLRLSFTMAARALAMSALVLALVSILYGLALPDFGIHQTRDQTQAVHAGAWRGSYYHKNHLGQTCAVIAVGLILASRRIIPSVVVKWGLVAAMTGLIALSTSASGAITVPIALALHWLLIELPPAKRLRTMLYLVPVIIGGVFLTSQVLMWLGRDLTLTGRTDVWSIAWSWFSERPVEGYGYNTLTYGGFSFELSRKRGVIDPHNGYFETALGTGVIGLVLFLVPLVMAVSAARKQYAAGGIIRDTAAVFSGVMIAWMIASFTEVDFRPFAAAAGPGFFAMFALLMMPRPGGSAGPRFRAGR